MNDQHSSAQELSVRAATLLAEGDAAEARRLFGEAAKQEEAALAALPADSVRTRSVLCVSVASLLYKAVRLDQAERAIFSYLASRDLDAWAEGQLRELLSVVSDERQLVSTLDRRYSGETITVSLRGGQIGAGTGPLDLVLEKAAGFRSLLYRAAEWVGEFPLRHQGPPPKELQELVQARVAEPAAGSYRLEIRLTEPVQPQLFEPPRVPPAELSERLFEFLQCLTRGNPKDVEDLVPQTEYRKALLQLTRNITPRGKRVREIGIYRTKDGRLETVCLTEALPSKIWEAMPKDTSSAEERRSYRGVLRALHLDSNWLMLKLEDGIHIKCDTVHTMLDDVVGPMVNRNVSVTGTLRQRQGAADRLLVSEIDFVDEE